MSRIRSDRGQATVLAVVFLAALIGMCALVLDVGSWFREQRDTQSDADAAALAAAQELPSSVSAADALGRKYLVKNGVTTAPDIRFSKKFSDNDTVTVRVNRPTPGVFSKLFGVDSVNVGAKATARATGLSAARWVAPIVVNVKHPMLNCDRDADHRPVPCFGEETTVTLTDLHQPGGGDASGSFGLINLDQDDTGSVGAGTIGNWIEKGFDEYLELGRFTAVTSADFNSTHTNEALAARMNDVLLFPIYKSITGPGTNAEYDIVGWVGFKVTGFDTRGSSGTVTGEFTEVIWDGIQSKTGANSNYGVRTVALVE
jgi:hypothetical protein